jgi:hypothetical protein
MMSVRPTLLLVHGAWHGAWCWDELIRVLTERGWEVRAIDLPTVHAPHKERLGMQDDADAVRAAIDAVAGPVVVVAHSYGGVPVTQAADAPNVQHIVYVAAFVLDAGESLLAAVGGIEPEWWHVDGLLATAGDELRPPRELFFADASPDVAAAATAKLLPQAVRSFHDPVTSVAWRGKETTYVITEQDAIFPLPAQEALAARSGSAAPRLDTSHSPFLSQPDALADIVELAAGG